MASKDYPKPEAEANQQSQQRPTAQSGADTSQILATLTQVFSTFQKQLQNQPPREIDANALTAASVFNDIVAGLELRPLKNLPDLKNAQTVSSTEIKLEWEWTDADGYTAQGFKIWRCKDRAARTSLRSALRRLMIALIPTPVFRAARATDTW